MDDRLSADSRLDALLSAITGSPQIGKSRIRLITIGTLRGCATADLSAASLWAGSAELESAAADSGTGRGGAGLYPE
ncbi:hypothetical protein IFO70_06840 [Phormidium tenue FACHB-886]|nr:hypothetical protein [Phormidium tenue FACHB-886]